MHERKEGHFSKKPITIHARPAVTGEKVLTLESEHELVAGEGDWIITGVEGEHYPIKAEVFAKTYDRLSDITESK